MNIDERLERLTERHEALAQSLELHEAQSKARGDRLDARIDRLVDSIQDLVGIVRSHETRINRLEHEVGQG